MDALEAWERGDEAKNEAFPDPQVRGADQPRQAGEERTDKRRWEMTPGCALVVSLELAGGYRPTMSTGEGEDVFIDEHLLARP